ncbi:MAG: hypothetical protein QGG40_19385, partial [Myxococcota bacterium]|nr:hypothetical protein [Myxococcota bacterium]
MTSGRSWTRAAPWLLLVVTALSFARLWFVEYSWDDEALVKDNQLTGSLANLPELFVRDLWSTTRLPTLKSGYYRPLLLLSLAVDRAAFGLSSTFAHVHSLAWHLLAVWGLYGLLRRLLTPDEDTTTTGPALGSIELRALLGATVFALHPVQSEVLALVAARNDSMAAAFTVLALWILCSRTVSGGKLVGAGVLAFLGLLSKESAVLVPLLLLALDLARWGRPVGWRRYASLGAALAAYVGLRIAVDVGGELVPDEGNWALVGRHAAQVLGVYGSLVVWPWPLTPARHVHYLPHLGNTLLGLLVCLGLLGWLWARGPRKRLVLAGLVWAGLSFAPTLAATLDKGL